MSRSASPDESPSLERLVAYFVAAKKSLASTSHVYQANDIVEDARALVETEAVLKAKNTYVRNGVQEQVRILGNIHGGLEAVGHEAQLDFQEVVKSLDVANDRLQATLSSLRKTIVSANLGASQSEKSDKEDKTLYHFIDESTHTDLLDSLRATIDRYNDAQATLHRVRTTLGESLVDINARLEDIQDSSQLPAHPDDDTPNPFHTLTSNATEMASLLQSLISHYDLCITALKHTEGGGEAARAATSSPTPLSASESPTEASLYAGAAAEANRAPISDSEREEMLSVLTADAAQVPDVVSELRDRATEMSSTLAALTSSTDLARSRSRALEELVSRLTTLSTTLLPTTVSASNTFRATWSALRETLIDKTAALADLAAFHDAFTAAYANLLREVDRRAMVEAKMRKIAERAARDMEALRAEDADMRSQFVREVGEWLPRDIWPGLTLEPARWEVTRITDRNDDT